MKKYKKSKKWLRKFGNKNAQHAYDFMHMGYSKRQLANDLSITLDELASVEAQSPDFHAAIELCTQINLADDIEFLKKKMIDKGVNGSLVKLYFTLQYNIGDKPVETETDLTEDFGFDITVRKAN